MLIKRTYLDPITQPFEFIVPPRSQFKAVVVGNREESLEGNAFLSNENRLVIRVVLPPDSPELLTFERNEINRAELYYVDPSVSDVPNLSRLRWEPTSKPLRRSRC